MLWSRSASLTRITRMSSTIASSILRKFSACRSSLDEKGIAPSLVTPSTTWATSCAEQLPDPLDRGLRVLDDVVEQAGGDRDDVQLHVGQLVRHLERDGRGRARRNGGPAPCARRPRTRTPA